jgi:undecaprenyl-diphosphatase
MRLIADIDLWLFRLANAGGASPWLDRFFLWLTAPPARGWIFVLLALALSVFGGRRGRAAVLVMLAAVAATDLTAAELVKPALDRLRPCFALPEVSLLLPRQAHSPSFPSSHAANAFAVAVLLFPVSRSLGVGGILIAALIAYSRLYLGVHYPSDLLGGTVLGILIALACKRLLPRAEAWVGLAEDRLRRRSK